MRKCIIGLSVLFFVLAGIITFRALSIQKQDARYQYEPQEERFREFMPEHEDMPAQESEARSPDQSVRERKQTSEEAAVMDDKDAGTDSEDAAKVEAPQPAKEARVLAVLGSGFFRPGQIRIHDKQVNIIRELVPDILAARGYHVIVEGHTDNMPIRPTMRSRYRDNMELSFLRARAVADLLVEHGVSRDDISVIGRGDTRPVASNETPEGRIKNRRVVVRLVPADGVF